MEMNEDDFVKYLKTFVGDVWGLLLRVSQKPGQVGGHSPKIAWYS
jgi:hypothetical protein